MPRAPKRATMQRRAAAARVFFAWALASGRLAADPATGLRSPRVDRRLPPTLEVDHARRALEALAADAAALDDPMERARRCATWRSSGALRQRNPGGGLCGLDAGAVDVARQVLQDTARGTRNAPSRSAIRPRAPWPAGVACGS